jgi:hypothetical protein
MPLRHLQAAGESSSMKAILSLAVALAGFLPILPAQALTADGLTYTLTAFTTANPDVDNFTLTISGINGSSDTEAAVMACLRSPSTNPPGTWVSQRRQPESSLSPAD